MKQLYKWIVLAAVFILSANTFAQDNKDEVEREYLARIAHELSQVENLAGEAALKAPTGQKVKFRYDWLIKDLKMMREGVASHMDTARQPRPVTPLRGDYRQ